MKEITLNGKFMASESSAQEYLFDVFDFPEYYGNDLEGFYDALTDITEENMSRLLIVNVWRILLMAPDLCGYLKMPPVTTAICRWPGQK